MKERATIYDYTRLCKNTKSCKICPLDTLRNFSENCLEEMVDNTDKANEIILKWCKEHPVKTRQDKFLEMFPKASTYNTFIDICPCKVDYNYDCKNISGHYGEVDCCDCKKSYWLTEVE